MINKRILALICALAMLLLAGCGERPEVPLSETDVVSGADVSETTTTTTTTTTAPPIGNATEKAPMNDDGTGLFFMDMPFETFKIKAEELGWTTYDSPAFSGNTYSANLSTDDVIYFTFNKNNQLVKMNVLTSCITTEKGLKNGDAESRIEQLYGQPTNYESWEDGRNLYEYSNGDIILSICVVRETQKVYQWKIGYTEYVDW